MRGCSLLSVVDVGALSVNCLLKTSCRPSSARPLAQDPAFITTGRFGTGEPLFMSVICRQSTVRLNCVLYGAMNFWKTASQQGLILLVKSSRLLRCRTETTKTALSRPPAPASPTRSATTVWACGWQRPTARAATPTSATVLPPPPPSFPTATRCKRRACPRTGAVPFRTPPLTGSGTCGRRTLRGRASFTTRTSLASGA